MFLIEHDHSCFSNIYFFDKKDIDKNAVFVNALFISIQCNIFISKLNFKIKVPVRNKLFKFEFYIVSI